MFAYNPAVTDRSAEILTSANNQAAAIQLQGMQSLSQGIGNAMQSLGDGYAKANENKMTSDYLDEMASFYSRVKGPDGQPLISDETLQAFSKGSLGKKQGIITPVAATYDQMLKNSYLDRQMAGHIDRLYQNAANQAALRQPAPNQIPMGSGNPPPASNPPTDTNTPTTPVFGAGIQTRRVY
jgi:hypothetical protein